MYVRVYIYIYIYIKGSRIGCDSSSFHATRCVIPSHASRSLTELLHMLAQLDKLVHSLVTIIILAVVTILLVVILQKIILLVIILVVVIILHRPPPPRREPPRPPPPRLAPLPRPLRSVSIISIFGKTPMSTYSDEEHDKEIPDSNLPDHITHILPVQRDVMASQIVSCGIVAPYRTVGFHNFNLRIVNSRVSNPNTLIVDAFCDTMSDFNVPGSRPKKIR